MNTTDDRKLALSPLAPHLSLVTSQLSLVTCHLSLSHALTPHCYCHIQFMDAGVLRIEIFYSQIELLSRVDIASISLARQLYIQDNIGIDVDNACRLSLIFAPRNGFSYPTQSNRQKIFWLLRTTCSTPGSRVLLVD